MCGPTPSRPTGQTDGRRSFGVFEADLATGELRRQGVRIPLADQPFQLLAALLERPGEVVTRDELRSALWAPGIHVDFDASLNSAVKKLREALGDSARGPRFVETLPKRGYRFVAPVLAAGDPIRPAKSRTPWIVALAAVLLVGLTIGAGVLLRTPAVPDRLMLAVLPLENLTADPGEEYFVDGVTEELLTHLGRLQPERLGVIARHSAMTYKGSDKSLSVIGRELGVEYLLEGSVRRDRNRVRVTVQLILAADQTHLWAETYDADRWDVLEIQELVARQVAESLALRLLPDEPRAHARAATAVTEAFDEYLRGRHRMAECAESGCREAVAHFERALELDPLYDRAWAGLANAYALLAFTSDGDRDEVLPAARSAAARALELDPYLPEAHTAMGVVELYYALDPGRAVETLGRALGLDANHAVAHHWLGGALAALGRFDEASDAVARAIKLDPAVHSRQADRGWFLLFGGRYQEALRECDRVLRLVPDDGWALECRREASYFMGRWDEAQLAARLRLRGMGVRPEDLSRISTEPAREAFMALERLRAERLLAEVEPRNGRALELAMVLARMGERERAGEWLGAARLEREPMLVFLDVDPRLEAWSQSTRAAESGR